MTTTDRLRDLISRTGGRAFGLVFRKRSTKQLRRMTCRLGVTSHLDPSATPDPGRPDRDLKHDLVTVFDLASNGYRCVPLDAVTEITVDGVTFHAQREETT